MKYVSKTFRTSALDQTPDIHVCCMPTRGGKWVGPGQNSSTKTPRTTAKPQNTALSLVYAQFKTKLTN